MKILLINPPVYRNSGYAHQPSAEIPIGLLYLAGYMKRHGDSEISILDAALPESQTQYHQGTWWGLPLNDIIRRIQEIKPDGVGISCRYSSQYRIFIDLIRQIKLSCDPAIVLFAGGTHASVDPDSLLANEARAGVDLIIAGEAEQGVLNLTKQWPQSGTGHTDLIHSPAIERIDEIPFPAYELIDVHRYYELQARGFFTRRYTGTGGEVPVITSRGCPYTCSFCSVHTLNGRGYRAHSSEYVLEHLEVLFRKHNARFIHFEDDNLTLDRNRFRAILDGITRSNFGWAPGTTGFAWDTPNGVRVDSFDEDLVIACRRAGCCELTIALESGCERIRKEVIGKNIEVDAVHRMAHWCRKHGMPLYNFMIIGFPDETPSEMEISLRLARDLLRRYGVLSSFFAPTPLPGTALFREVMADQGLLHEPFNYDQLLGATSGHRHAVIRNRYYNRDRLADLVDEFNRYQTRWSLIHRLTTVSNYIHWGMNIIRQPAVLKQYADSLYSAVASGLKRTRR